MPFIINPRSMLIKGNVELLKRVEISPLEVYISPGKWWTFEKSKVLTRIGKAFYWNPQNPFIKQL